MDTNKMSADLGSLVEQAITGHPGYAEFLAWCQSQLMHPHQIYFLIWQASRDAVAAKLTEPYAWIGDYAACGGGKAVFDRELAEAITDRMCHKEPVYDIASLEAAGLKVKP